LDSYIGQIESKLDQAELDRHKADIDDAFKNHIIQMKKYTDEQVAKMCERVQGQKESVSEESEERMQIKLLEA
jgi:predicted Zn-dependent protease